MMHEKILILGFGSSGKAAKALAESLGYETAVVADEPLHHGNAATRVDAASLPRDRVDAASLPRERDSLNSTTGPPHANKSRAPPLRKAPVFRSRERAHHLDTST